MSTTEELSLITTQMKNHVRVQKTLNEILVQTGNSTVQMLTRKSDESLSSLEIQIETLIRTVDERNFRVTMSTSTTTCAAVSAASTSLPRSSSRLKESKIPARRSASVGTESMNLCVICLDTVADAESHARAQPTAVDGCNHVFHNSCLKGWLKVKKTCPTCRNTVEKRQRL